MKTTLNAREIQELLLQRYPILLVDRILDIIVGKRIVGLKNFTVNEPYMQGHFPGNPVVPGTILIEAMAQVGAIFVMETEPEAKGKLLYLARLEGVRFRIPVVPGDQVIFDLVLLKRKKDVWKVKGIAKVEGTTVMEATILAVVLPEILEEKK